MANFAAVEPNRSRITPGGIPGVEYLSASWFSKGFLNYSSFDPLEFVENGGAFA